MTQKEKKYVDEILAVINKHKLIRISHIFPHYKKLGSSQFYNLGLEKSEEIREALELNRVTAVNYLFQKWVHSDNATLQIAAMRLCCSSEEHKLLNQNYVDHSSNGRALPPLEFKVIHGKDESNINNHTGEST